jgi:hypothetical protein
MGGTPVSIAIEAENVEFFSDDHSYRMPDGRKVMSVTQILSLAGLVNYEGIPAAILEYAAWRGTMVHQVTNLHDQGIDVEANYDIPEEILPYYRAWVDFKLEFDFIPDLAEIERPRVVTVRGIEYAMTPDAPGTMRGIPTVVEKKATAAVHATWGIQLAGYEMGLKRPAGYRTYQRIAVQLKKDARCKVIPFEAATDHDLFQHAHAIAAWKLNNRLAKLAA